MNCSYIIREAYNKVCMLCRFLSVDVVGSLTKVNAQYDSVYIPGEDGMKAQGGPDQPIMFL